MWIQHKVKNDGEKLEEIAKQYKIKDIKPLLQYRDNKKVAELHKKKKPLTKGMVVYVLDPNAKCYVAKDGSKEVLLTEDQWKDATAALNKAMDKVAKGMRREFDSTQGRHFAQNDVNVEFPIVAFLSSNWVGGKGNEPTTTRRSAKAAVEKLEKVAAQHNYKDFEASVKEAERALNAYRAELGDWLEQLTGSAGNWATGLRVTSIVSFTIFGAAASTVAAPATLVGTIAVGAGVGAGSSFLQSGANEIGEVYAGGKADGIASLKTIAGDMVEGAAWGAAGSVVSRFIGNLVAPKLAEKMVTSPVATKFASKLVYSQSSTFPKLTQRLVERELAKAGVNLANGTIFMPLDKAIKMANDLAAQVTIKFFVRLGTGGVRRTLQEVLDSSSNGQPVHTYLDQNATKIKGKMDETKLAELVAKDLENDPALYKAFEAIINDNMKEIEAELCTEIQNGIQANMKKANKK
jgi:hypothetical protein